MLWNSKVLFLWFLLCCFCRGCAALLCVEAHSYIARIYRSYHEIFYTLHGSCSSVELCLYQPVVTSCLLRIQRSYEEALWILYRCVELKCGMLVGKCLIISALSINVVVFSVNHWLCLFWPASLSKEDLSFDSGHFSLFFGIPPSFLPQQQEIQYSFSGSSSAQCCCFIGQ